MNPSVCKSNEYCDIGGSKHTIINIFLHETIQGQCKEYHTTHLERYLGEDCDSVAKCIAIGSQCVEGKCTGNDKDERCKSRENCQVGLYCDNSTTTCKEQKRKVSHVLVHSTVRIFSGAINKNVPYSELWKTDRG